MNVPTMEHLSFERGTDGKELIATFTINGTPGKARLHLAASALALADLLRAFGLQAAPPASPLTLPTEP